MQEVIFLKKILCGFMTLILALTMVNVCSIFAYNIPSTVRVGLEYKYKNVSSVPISEIKIQIGENGKFETEISSSGNGFTISVSNESFVEVEKNINSYENAVYIASNYIQKGYSAFPAYRGYNNWSIYIGGFTDTAYAETVAKELDGSISYADKDKMILKDTNSAVMIFDDVRPQIRSGSREYTLLSDRSYRGFIEFGRYTGENITAVNVVGLEEYLYSVVPSEMPASYGEEALKAQAVAARSYTMTRLHAHASAGYELCDNTHCQMYKGYGGESAKTNNAVDSTKGIMAYYDGSPINAVFHASSGGHTDNAENVWVNEIPYLKGVPEFNEIDMNTWSREFTSGDIESIVSANGDYVGKVTDIVLTKISDTGHIVELKIVGTAGEKIVSKESIRSYFSSKGGSLESRVFTINGKGTRPLKSDEEYVPPTDNGDVETETPKEEESLTSQVSVLGANGLTKTTYIENSYIISKNDTLSSDNNTVIVQGSGGNSKVYYTKDGSSNLTSAQNVSSNLSAPIETGKNMMISQAPVSTANGTGKFVFEGYGWGHGAGMSQKGANGMAQMGYDYIEILTHYYTGVEVQ